MPELLVDFITSLDGYGAAEGWPGWWGLEGPEYLAWLNEQLDPNETVLMGANTYRLMSGFAADGEPGTDVLAGLNKVVFSTTLTEPLAWANTKLVARDAVEAVREMKSDGSSPMRTMGSLTVCRALLKAGLVDRFRVVVFPVITGKHRSRPHLRWLSGRGARDEEQPHVRRPHTAPGVRPHASRRAARRRGVWWSEQ